MKIARGHIQGVDCVSGKQRGFTAPYKPMRPPESMYVSIEVRNISHCSFKT